MLPLTGLRILAVEQYGAGPFGTMLLADMGAEVIKIENPTDGGDMARGVGPHFMPDGSSQFFHSFNRNKRSLTLDLKAPEGRALFLPPRRDRRCRAEQSARQPARQARPRLRRARARRTRQSSAPTSRPMAATARAPAGPASTT